jgi:hypothetical protein
MYIKKFSLTAITKMRDTAKSKVFTSLLSELLPSLLFRLACF